MSLIQRMAERAEGERDVNVAVVGAGFVGRGLTHRLARTAGMTPAVIANRTTDRGIAAYAGAGYEPGDVLVSDDPRRVTEAIEAGRPVVVSTAAVLCEIDAVDIVVEATGGLEYGARTILDAMAAGKDVVSLNAELDALLGYLLHREAQRHGAVYTICDGDQPGGLLRQLEAVTAMGFEVVAAVNCKRHLDVRQNPDSSAVYVARDGTSPAVTTAAGDGTKLQVESTVVANTWGLPPDCRGMHGIPTTLDRAVEDLLAAISRPGVVEYTLGGDFGAGVFVIGRTPDHETVRQSLRFFKMGEGPDYLFLRPHTLVFFEMPFTIAEVVLDRQPIAAPGGPPVAEAITIAKRALRPGEPLDGIGGFTNYGQIDSVAASAGLLPIGLSEHARMRRTVEADVAVTLDDVELDEDAEIVRLRRRQDELIDALRTAGNEAGRA